MVFVVVAIVVIVAVAIVVVAVVVVVVAAIVVRLITAIWDAKVAIPSYQEWFSDALVTAADSDDASCVKQQQQHKQPHHSVDPKTLEDKYLCSSEHHLVCCILNL